MKDSSESCAPLLDHVTDVYNILSSKYPKGLLWILAGRHQEDEAKYLSKFRPKDETNSPVTNQA